MHILISAVSSARRPSGICRHAANLASSLIKTRGVSRITLLVGAWQKAYFSAAFNLARTPVELTVAGVENTALARNLWYYRALPRLSRDLGADIVHLSFPAPIARRNFNCAVICSLHDLYPYDVPANFGSARVLFNRLFLRQCLQQSDAVVCSSDFTRQRLQLHASDAVRRKATRIYQSVSLDPGSARQPTFMQAESGGFLLSVAQHRSNKNLPLLLSAFAALRARYELCRKLRLLIIGANGPVTKTLVNLVKQHSLGDHVIFQSALPDPELCWLYEHADLVVLPSTIEGFCLPLAEALRCGSKVLCSDIPILREVGAGHCHYFCLNSHDPVKGLAHSIVAALASPKLPAESTPRFSPESIAQQYLALYRSLVPPAPQSNPTYVPIEDVLPSQKYAV